MSSLLPRSTAFAVILGAAVTVAGCGSTVDGRAAVSATPLTLAVASPSADATGTSDVRTPDPGTPETVDDTDETVDAGGYTDLAPGDAVTVWDDNGEADLYVRGASFDGGTLDVTVDYECFDGRCPYDVSDWTVTDASGERHPPVDPSGFGDGAEQIGLLQGLAQKRGHLVFDVSGGPVTIEFDAASGDPATWLIPAA